MGCGCKSNVKNNDVDQNVESVEKSTLIDKIVKNKYYQYSVKFLIFLFSIVVLFLVLPYVFYFMFKTIVLNKDTDMGHMLKKLIPKKNKWKKNEDDDDYDDDDGDELYENEFGEDYDDIIDNNGVKVVEVLKENKN